MSRFYDLHRRHTLSTEEPRRNGTQNGIHWVLGAFVLLAVLVLSSIPSAQAQTVTDVRPESGVSGDTVRIYGSQLGTGTVSAVTIGGETASILNQSSTLLEVEVPSGVSGPAVVEVGTATAADRFTVISGGSTAFGPDSTLAPTRNGEVTRGDLDGDGDLDLLVTGTDGSGNPVTTLYYNDGTGRFSVASDVSSSIVNVSNGTADFADVNGNGRLDILLTGTNGSGTPVTKLYTNEGGSLDDGSLAVTDQVSDAPSSGFENSAADLGDVDGDGNVDLVVAGDTTGSDGLATMLYTNDGSGSFSPATVSSDLVDAHDGTIDVGDVNGDGSLDLVVTGDTTGGPDPTLTVYENDGGASSFTTTLNHDESTGPAVFNSAADLGDVNGNGALDLIVTGDAGLGYAAEFFTNDGAGNFSVAESLSPAVENGTADFADVDGDGDLDLLMTGGDGGDFSPYATLYEYDGSFSATTDLTGVTNSGAAFADYDGDGKINFFLTGATGSGSSSATLYQPVMRPTSTTPGPNEPSFSTTSNMEFVFNLPVADLTGLADSIVVRGSQNGTIDDDGSLSGGSEQLSYGPSPPFAPGERVSVLFKDGLESTGGLPFFRPIGFSFRAAAAKGPASFLFSRAVSNSETDARSVAAGYLTGNGNLDLVVTATGDDEVTLYEGNGDGTFTSGSVLDSGITYARPLTLADLNDDGLLDVVVGSGESASSDPNDIIRYYLNQGSGSFGEGQDITNGGNADDVRDLETEDFDGDGNVDLVAVTSDNNSVYVYWNNADTDEDGNPEFTEAAINSGNADDPRAVHVKDVDSNGNPDLIVGSVSDDNVSWYPNNAGSFGSEQVIESSNAINPRDLDAADFDEDGLPEVVAAQRGTDSSSGDGAVAVYDPFVSSFDQSISWSQSEVASTDSVLTTTTADVNADGLIDIVAGSVGGDSLVWYENTGGGGSLSFGSANVLDTGVHDVQGLTAADADGDGSLDPVVASFAEDRVLLYPNLAGPSVIDTSPTRNTVGVDTSRSRITFVFDKPLDANTVDANSVSLSGEQSGRISPSSVGLSSSNEELEVELESGFTFHPGEEVTVSVLADSVVAVDGAPLDTTFAFSFTTETSSGEGSFASIGAGLTGVQGGSVDAGDFNGDGRLDLVVTGDSDDATTAGGDTTAVYRNDGGGVFTAIAASDNLVNVEDGSSAKWGDYNGDGNLDLVVTGATGSGQAARIYRNNGDGTFTEVANEGGVLTGVQNSSVSWGDYDGDGDQDLVVTGFDGGGRTANIYRYDGGDTFTNIGASIEPVQEQTAVEWADYDEDGDLDLLISGNASLSGDNTSVWRNQGDADGDGTVEFSREVSLSEEKGGSVDWGDYNGDGHLDFVLTGEDSFPTSTTTIYRGDGTGGFTPINTSVDSVTTGAASWGDFTGDDRLDLVVAGDRTGSGDLIAKIYEGDGAGGFSALGAGLTPVDSAATAWGDFNGDGVLDLVVAGIDNNGTPTTTIYEQIAPFEVASTSPTRNAVGVDTSLTEITVSFNKDVDSLTVSNDSIQVYGSQSGYFPESDGTVGIQSGNTLVYQPDGTFQPGETVTVHLDSAITDIEGVPLQAHSFSFRAGVTGGTGQFEVLNAGVVGVTQWADAEWGDFDNDGNLDLVVVGQDTSGSPSATVYQNDGSGGFTDIGAGLTGVDYGSAAWGDYNRDGNLDLIVVGEDVNNNTTALLYEGDGAGGFTALSGTGVTGVGRGADVAWEDYNGDGFLDLVVAGSQSTTIYRNNGDGTFTDVASLLGVNFASVAWGDYNNDGNTDLLFIGKDPDANPITRLYRQEDDGTFTVVSNSLPGYESGSVAWGDFNQNGRLGFVVAALDEGFSATTQLYSSDGDGTFTSEASLANAYQGEAEWADYNGDGALDLALTGNQEAIVYQNDGSGSFANVGAGLNGVTLGGGTWGDADGDGSLDLMVVGEDDTGTPTATLYRQLQVVSPTITADGADQVTDSSARLNGTVNPGGDTARVYFEFGRASNTDSDLIAADTLTTNLLQDQAVSVATPDTLQESTEYEFAAVAVTAVDSVVSDTLTFTTEAAPPIAQTGEASSVADSSATLNATVDPGGALTTVTFDVGPDTTYGRTVQATDSLSGTAGQVVSTSLDGLRPGTEYHYRARASNNIGSDQGTDSTFVTGPSAPVALAGSASSITDTSAVVAGTINPGGAETRAEVVYYQSGNPSSADTVEAAVGLVGTEDTTVTTQLTGLELGTEYAYRVRGTNEVETRESKEQTFQTLRVSLAVPDTVEAGIGSVGSASRAAEVTVENTGETRLTGLSASIEGADSSDYALQSESALEDSLEIEERQSLQIQFEPSATGLREARLVVTSSEGAADTAAVRGWGAALTVDAAPPARGASANIVFTLEGGIDAILGEDTEEASTLYARKGGTRTYRALPLSETGQDPVQFQGQVPDTLVTPRGIDYFAVVVVEGPTGRRDTLTVPGGGVRRARQAPRHLPVQFEMLSPPSQTNFRAEAYRMVSVPAIPNDGIKAALEARYGAYDRGEWRVLRWDAGEETYREFPAIDSLQVGEGFWLITAEGTPPRVEGGQTPNADEARELTLEPGWNQVGSPFGYPVPWDSVQAASNLSGEGIDGPIAYRDSAYRPGQSRLTPWEAYFVFNAQSERDTLVVPPVGAGGAAASTGQKKRLAGGGQSSTSTASQSEASNQPTAQRKTSRSGLRDAPDEAASRRPSSGRAPASSGTSPSSASSKVAAESASAAESSYTLRVNVRPVADANERRPSSVTLGLRSAAKSGRDRFDRAQAPPIGQALRLGALQETGGRSVPHAESFKPSEGEGRVWRLRLTNRREKRTTVRLGLEETGTLPPNQQLYILDLEAERRRAPGAQFELGAGATRILKVIVGTENYAEAESEGLDLDTFTDALRGNYPNPFEETTTIAYTLKSRRESVTVSIYDVLGRKINTLTEGANRSAGLHQVQWDGTNRQGRPVGSGVYFYRVEAEGFQKTRKMVLVR